MKVVILAGGLPSTIIEQDEKIPKPMAEIGERPILWHIMKYFAAYGNNEFIICGGYKVDVIKEYFMNYYIHQSDITVDLGKNEVVVHRKETDDWKVSVVDTGMKANIPQRICAIRNILDNEDFIIVYGDCLYNIAIDKMIELHRKEKKIATMTVARPSGRNQILPICDREFKAGALLEDIKEEAWVNACCMIFSQGAFSYIDDHNSLEHALFHIGNENKLSVFCHEGFWSPIETVRDRDIIEKMWNEGRAPWKIW